MSLAGSKITVNGNGTHSGHLEKEEVGAKTID